MQSHRLMRIATGTSCYLVSGAVRACLSLPRVALSCADLVEKPSGNLRARSAQAWSGSEHAPDE
jgi:hypothetical protein